MNKLFKVFGIIALVAIIGFSMAACGDDDDPPSGGDDDNPTAVSWTGFSANGSANVTTTELTLTFNEDFSLNIDNVTVTGATKGTLSGYGTTRTLTISNITVAKGENVTVTLTNPTGYTITPSSKTIAINKGWTAVADSTFGNSSIYTIAYGNGKFFAWGSVFTGKMATSSDGVTWTAVTDSNYSLGGSAVIAYGNSKFVAGYSNKIAYSSDGVTWTAVTDSPFNSIDVIAYGNGKFVAGNEFGKMAYSSDGVTWTAVTDSIFGNSYIEAIAYGNGKFVAGGSTLYVDMAYSSDGVTWTAVTDSPFNFIDVIAYGNGKFVAGGDYGKMAYSSDGVTWTAVADNPFDSIYASGSTLGIGKIAYGNGKFVACGSGDNYSGMAYSTDGVTWTAETDSKFEIDAIVYGNNTFVALKGDEIFYWKDN